MLQSIINASINERPKRIRLQCKSSNISTRIIPTVTNAYTNTEVISSDIGINTDTVTSNLVDIGTNTTNPNLKNADTNTITTSLINVGTSTITPVLKNADTNTITPSLINVGTSTMTSNLKNADTNTITHSLIDVGTNTTDWYSTQTKKTTKHNENKLLSIMRKRNKIALAQKKFMASINKNKTKSDIEYDTDE